MVLRSIIFGIICILLSACFEILEDVSFKKDGSGKFKLIINMSQSKNEINTLLKLDSSSGYKIPTKSQINLELDKAVNALKKTEGLSDVSLKKDYVNWIFELNTSFKNTDALDRGFKNIHSIYSNENELSLKFKLSFRDKLMIREMEPLDEKTRKNLNKPTEKRIFAAAKYITIYHFESDIRKSSNSRAKISPSKKAVMLQSNVLKLINGNETLKNNITINEP